MNSVAKLSVAVTVAAILALILGLLLRDETGELTPPPPTSGIEAPGGVTGEETPAVRRAPVEVTPGDSRRGSGILRGIVEDRSGRAVASANVVARRLRAGSAASSLERLGSAVTDSSGRFVIQDLPLDRLGVTARHEGRSGSVAVSLAPSAPEREITLSIDAAGSISGRVETATGEPVAGARITPEKRQESPAPLPVDEGALLATVTGDDGAFTVDALEEGSWRFLVRAAGFAPHLTSFLAVGTDDAVVVIARGFPVSGRVVDHDDGSPVAGVEVVIQSAVDEDRYKATTGEDGLFQIADVRDAEFEIGVEDETRVVVGIPERFSVAGRPVTDLMVPVAAGGVVTGRVYDEEKGAGLAGVRVWAAPVPQRLDIRGHPVTLAAMETDGDGRYRLRALAAGSAAVQRGPAEGFGNAQWDERRLVSIEHGQAVDEIDFPLLRGIAITGVVVDQEGAPVGRANVQANMDARPRWHSTHSGPDGAFELLGFDGPGVVYLNVVRDGYAFAAHPPVDLPGEGLTEVELVLSPESTISGIVVDPAGRPHVGVRVQPIIDSPRQRFGAGSTTTNARGEFTLRRLSAGTYGLLVQPAGSQVWGRGDDPDRSVVELREAELVEGVRVVWEDRATFSISGSVRDVRGGPLMNASVNCQLTRGGSGGHAVSDASGRYEVAGLPEGTYTVRVQHGAHAAESREGVAAGSTEVDFDLRGRATISGVVVDGETGQPIPAFGIAHAPGRFFAPSRWHRYHFVEVRDDRGRFRLPAVDAGEVTLVVHKQGYPDTFHPVGVVEAEQSIEDVRIAVRAGETLVGEVRGPDGEVVSGARIFVGAPPDRRLGGASLELATTDDAGRFTIDALPPDSEVAGTRVSALHPDYPPATVTFPGSPPGLLTIVFGRGVIIEGAVTLGGEPQPGSRLTFFQPDGDGANDSAATGPDGSYRRGGLAAGATLVSVSLRAGGANRTATSTVDTEDGGTHRLDFEFPVGTATLLGTVKGAGIELGSANLSLALQAGGRQEVFNLLLAADGRFRFENIPAGKGVLRVSLRGAGRGPAERGVAVEIAAGETIHKDIDLDFGAVVHGSVLELDGDALTMVTAMPGRQEIETLDPELFSRLQALISAMSPVTPEGTFRLTGLEAGEYTIFAVSFKEPPRSPADFGKARFVTDVVTVEEGEAMEMVLPLPQR